MTATLAQIRAGIQTALRTIATFDPGQVHATRVATITPPATIVEPAPGEFYEYDTSSDSHDVHLVILVLVSRADDASAWTELDPYVHPTGAQSISAAIEADPTLGGIVDDCDVRAAMDYGDYDIGGISYFGCQFALDVMLGG